MFKKCCIAGVLLGLGLSLSSAAIIHVDDDAPGDPGPGDPEISDPLEDGTPEHPFDAIQEGVDHSQLGDIVLLHDGTYTGRGNRTVEFGYQQREITVMSSGGPAHCVIDGEGLSFGGPFFYLGRANTLRGLTMRNGDDYRDGGALHCAGSATVINCLLENNSGGSGGAVRAESGDIWFHDCRFVNNQSEHAGSAIAAWGASVYCENCVFDSNNGASAGALWISGNEQATMRRCLFLRNRALSAYVGGGAITASEGPEVELDSCAFVGQSTPGRGGAIACWDATVRVANCTFHDNACVESGGAIACWEGGEVHIRNSILWNNWASLGSELAVGTWTPATLSVTFTDVMGGQTGVYVEPGSTLEWGAGNIDLDPLFVAPRANDFHLQASSPCIDAGDPAFAPAPGAGDFDDEYRLWDGDGNFLALVDMGADEFGSFHFGDLNCDGATDFGDINPFVLALTDPGGYQQTFPTCNRILADANRDGAVDFGDINPFVDLLLAAY